MKLLCGLKAMFAQKMSLMHKIIFFALEKISL